ncbi:MAG: Rieske 2Fe-2S domain-containing protein [Planctomycetia bacterium]|nr:Rieske 2Fe-2S domain-containing protein [Planctomycetia bacterium]
MSKPSQSSTRSGPAAAPPTPRRRFLTQAGALVFGGIVCLVPTLSGLAVLLDPLRRRSKAGKFIRVATLDSLPDDGLPRQFPVIAEHVDAWNRSLEPIGAVYLRRNPGELRAHCLTATCPHLGCFVNYDDESNTFKCPCHNSMFQVDGEMIEPSPSPRAMDTLECKIENEEVLVRFQNFYTGKTDKVAKG